MVVHPQGMDDIDKKNPSSWTSWHFNGTCQNGGVSCDTSKSNDNYCYESNPDCQDCDWTSCVDDVTFLTELYDYMEVRARSFGSLGGRSRSVRRLIERRRRATRAARPASVSSTGAGAPAATSLG